MSLVSESLAKTSRRLAPLSDTPELDAQVLHAHVLGRKRSWLTAHPEMQIDPPQAEELERLLLRLEQGEPLPYVLGEWEFFSLSFMVSPAVLIPRPETELLVERAIAWLRPRAVISTRPLYVLDVGTGSGCIAIALAINLPQLQLTATDLSPAALDVAHQNARRLNVLERIDFIHADLLPEIEATPRIAHGQPLSFVYNPASCDLVVANLPYIPTTTLQTLPVFQREPSLALDGGPDGLSLIRRLLASLPLRLAPQACILLELEATTGQAALSAARQAFPQATIRLIQDLAGRDRLLEIQN
jgi:release factor glutamine methyltransferase